MVTVHVVEPPVITLAGAHASDDTTGLIGATVTVAFALPPSAAVTVTVCAVATVPAVAVNEAELAAPDTVTDGGTASAAVLFDDSATALPPVGAA